MTFPHKTSIFAVLASALAIAAPPASSKDAISQKSISLEGAQKVLDAATAFAKKSGWPGVIAVTDPAGTIVLMARMDGVAVPAGVVIAPGKARTAALFRKPSADLEAAINGQRPALITSGDFVMMRGGVPLFKDGDLIGAIGVSTDTPDHDQAIAEAGADALD